MHSSSIAAPAAAASMPGAALYPHWNRGISTWWDSSLHRRFLSQPGNLDHPMDQSVHRRRKRVRPKSLQRQEFWCLDPAVAGQSAKGITERRCARAERSRADRCMIVCRIDGETKREACCLKDLALPPASFRNADRQTKGTQRGRIARAVVVRRAQDGTLTFAAGGELVDAVVEMARFDQALLADRMARIRVGAKEFQCVGALPPFDHPHVFLDMGKDNEIVCPYCSTLFVYDASLTPGTSEPLSAVYQAA